jgi:nucleotide-binding universal stress UspA family protein
VSVETLQEMKTRQREDNTPPPVWHCILVPMDFSAPSEAAFVYALKLAKISGAMIHVCHVIPVPHMLDAFYEHGLEQPESVNRIKQRARKRIKELALSAGADIAVRVHFCEGEALNGVLEQATKLKPDLIVMGTHGRRGAKRFFLGSVAEGVVRRASCPVLTLRSAIDAASQESKKGAAP